MKQTVQASRVNFNPKKPMQRFKAWQADLMARERGIIQYKEHTPSHVKAADRSTCERAVGACMKGETLKAHGAYEGPRGGVVPASSR